MTDVEGLLFCVGYALLLVAVVWVSTVVIDRRKRRSDHEQQSG